MKKYIIILILSFTSFSFYSCEDAYEEIEPIGLLDDEAAFYTIEEVQMVLNDLYLQLNNSNDMYFTAVFTDETKPGPSYNGTQRDIHNFVLNSTTGESEEIWYDWHRTVNRANRLINGVVHTEIIGATQDEIDQNQAELDNMVAQAKFIRAYAYLSLISYFSPDMTDNSALGAILFTDVPASNTTLPRATNGEIYLQIEEDLNWAFANLDSSNPFYFGNKAAVEALFARMYAYRGLYSQARTYAQNVVNNYGLSLTPGTPYVASNFYHYTNTTNPYRKIWVDAPSGTFPSDQLENIFSLQTMLTNAGFAPASYFYANATRLQGSPLWGMGLNLYNALTEAPNDVRQFAFVDPTTDLSINAIMIDKYPGISGGGGQLRNNLKLIRLSEMYFILAEAAVSESNLTQAADYLYQVRVARSTDGTAVAPSFGSVTDAWAGVLHERRKELCFEGHRYIDLRRLGALANQSIDRNPIDNEVENQATTLPITDHRFTLPIPFSELSVNPNVQQNPGY